MSTETLPRSSQPEDLITGVPPLEVLQDLGYGVAGLSGVEMTPVTPDGSQAEVAPTASAYYEVLDGMTMTKKVTRMYNTLRESEKPEDKNTGELANVLPIKAGVRVGEQEFMLSDTVKVEDKSGGRMHCVMYVELPDGTVAPRLLYKSMSDGDWRVAPYVEADGRYSKGEQFDSGYVRETRIVDSLRDFLNIHEQSHQTLTRQQGVWLRQHFTKEKLGSTYTYEKEADAVNLYGTQGTDLFTYDPGNGFWTLEDGRRPDEVFAQATIPEASSPNFTSLVTSREYTHSMLGKVTEEVFHSNRGTLAWHISRDEQGRVWVSGITGVNSGKPNTYGTDNEIVLGGLYDNKPLEYKQQVDGLRPGIDYVYFNGTYVDITPLLRNLPVIKAYEESLRARNPA